jgi:hypothetical protein
MRGWTFIIEFHAWRGVGLLGGGLFTTLCLGFVSVGFLPCLLSEKLKSRLNALKNALKAEDVPPRAEMSCI